VCLLNGFFAATVIVAIVNASQALDLYTIWIPFTILDGIIMLLTSYKVFPFRDGHNSTVALLARDSIVYFVVIFSTSLINIAAYTQELGFSLMIPIQCIACVSISRMMMNLRGLVMDDPGNTVRFQTLKFALNDVPDLTINATTDEVV